MKCQGSRDNILLVQFQCKILLVDIGLTVDMVHKTSDHVYTKQLLAFSVISGQPVQDKSRIQECTLDLFS